MTKRQSKYKAEQYGSRETYYYAPDGALIGCATKQTKTEAGRDCDPCVVAFAYIDGEGTAARGFYDKKLARAAIIKAHETGAWPSTPSTDDITAGWEM